MQDALAKEMTHDLEMNFNKIAPSQDMRWECVGNCRRFWEVSKAFEVSEGVDGFLKDVLEGV